MLSDLRKGFEAAVQDKTAAAQLWERLRTYEGTDPLIVAYKAAALSLAAREEWNPFARLEQLRTVMALFAQAVSLAPQNIEIRFLRFAIQHHLPGFLQLSGDLEEDMSVLKENMIRFREFHLEPDHVVTFVRFFKESQRFSHTDLRKMRSECDI
ncbi:MAG: hypothetical protein EAZ89_19980 [Bacteroidetes bacterium]|nr:MAG: hypothetical protein EAZ89_19980 [Bacteroidota bacterium]